MFQENTETFCLFAKTILTMTARKRITSVPKKNEEGYSRPRRKTPISFNFEVNEERWILIRSATHFKSQNSIIVYNIPKASCNRVTYGACGSVSIQSQQASHQSACWSPCLSGCTGVSTRLCSSLHPCTDSNHFPYLPQAHRCLQQRLNRISLLPC